MTALVFEHGGTVAKVMGDALYVLFGAPKEQHDHAARALACALAIDDFAEDMRRRWTAEGHVLGCTRIGIHAGPALVGTFGHEQLFDYTAYGDTINVASRLEAANKPLGTRLLVTDAVKSRAPEAPTRPVGDLVLRGRTSAIRCHEPLRPGTDAGAYAAAFALMEQRDPTALAAFAGLVAIAPQDHLASFHLRRLLAGEKGVELSMR